MSASTVPCIGAHVPAGGGLARQGLSYAADIGAEAIQVFAASPRAWTQAASDARQDLALRDRITSTGLPVFVHSPYLVNVGSPDPVTRERSAQSLGHSLRRGREIGARGVVVHTGSAAGGDRDKSLRLAWECLLPLLDSIPDDGPDLLLEPMAGQRQMLCGAVTELEPYLSGLGWHPRAGVCLDTCHAFGAGHDLAAPGGMAAMLDALTAALGGTAQGGQASRLKLIHANDAKDPCGSHRDRHENIGAGQIGRAAFADLLQHPATADVPVIIETPGPKAAHAADIAALKRLRQPGAG